MRISDYDPRIFSFPLMEKRQFEKITNRKISLEIPWNNAINWINYVGRIILMK